MKTIKNWFDLRKTYIIIFITLAGWSIFAHETMTNLITSQDIYAKIINLSGKQRMLSQKTTLIAKRYFDGKDKYLKSHLRELIDTMETDHKYIVNNLRTEKMKNTYYSEPLNLNTKVINYISLLNTFYENPSKEVLNNIERISFFLLPYLDKSVNLFEAESEEKTVALLNRENFILFGALLTLILEALFIVIPSIKIANKKEEELKELNTTLQLKIENAIKENRKKEKLLEQQFHLNQMTEMITNIAHQWRQPLSVISTIVSGMKIEKEMGILDQNNEEKFLNNILEKTQYLSNTIDSFNEFIRKDYNKKNFSLHSCINSNLAILNSTFEYEKIKLFREFYLEEIEIKGDESKFSQVLLNVINNAKDFLILRNIQDKWIIIKTYKENEHIVISIEDNAGGIDENIIDKIFDIYFTTKHQSQGTGLGLYISYEIIQKCFKGKIYVENSEFGARFIIELPIF
jgi:signal transduction histidine kinase